MPRKIKILINGLPEDKPVEVFKRALCFPDDFEVMHLSIAADETIDASCFSEINYTTYLIPASQREARMQKILGAHYPFIAIEFPLPNAVEEIAGIYGRSRIPFVIPAIGANINVLEKIVRESGICAIALASEINNLTPDYILQAVSSLDEFIQEGRKGELYTVE